MIDLTNIKYDDKLMLTNILLHFLEMNKEKIECAEKELKSIDEEIDVEYHEILIDELRERYGLEEYAKKQLKLF